MAVALAVALLVAAGVLVWQWRADDEARLRLATGTGRSGDNLFTVPAAAQGTDQKLNDVAAVGRAVVVVGSDTTGPTPRPLFLYSADGEEWQLGRVTGASTPIVQRVAERRRPLAGHRRRRGARAGSVDQRRRPELAGGRRGRGLQGRRPDPRHRQDGLRVRRGGRGGAARRRRGPGRLALHGRPRLGAGGDPGPGGGRDPRRGRQRRHGGGHGQASAGRRLPRPQVGRRRTHLAVDRLPAAGGDAQGGFAGGRVEAVRAGGHQAAYDHRRRARLLLAHRRRVVAVRHDRRPASGQPRRRAARLVRGRRGRGEPGGDRLVRGADQHGRPLVERAGGHRGAPGATLRGFAIAAGGTLYAGGDRAVSDVDNEPVLMAVPRRGEPARVPLDQVRGLTRMARETSGLASHDGRYVAVGSAGGRGGRLDQPGLEGLEVHRARRPATAAAERRGVRPPRLAGRGRHPGRPPGDGAAAGQFRRRARLEEGAALGRSGQAGRSSVSGRADGRGGPRRLPARGRGPRPGGHGGGRLVHPRPALVHPLGAAAAGRLGRAPARRGRHPPTGTWRSAARARAGTRAASSGCRRTG
ncbi:hypothetical protein ACFSTC_05615 [Nonomuraea ferruginea]